MFYNHELLKRSGRFGVLWLAATKPRLLTESEYRQCDLKTLIEEIREYIQYRTGREKGKPLFSLRTCTTLVIGATGVYIQQTKFMVRDCRRFSEKIYRINLGFDSQGNSLKVTLGFQSQHPDLFDHPAPSTSAEGDEGGKTPKGGKRPRDRKALRDDDEDEEEEEGKGKGDKRKKGRKDEDVPKKKRKGKTTLTDPEMDNTLQSWDSLYNNLLQGIPETDENDFFNPNATNVVDSSRITLKELVTREPTDAEMEDEAGLRVEQMIIDEAEMVVDPPLPQDLDVPDEEMLPADQALEADQAFAAAFASPLRPLPSPATFHAEFRLDEASQREGPQGETGPTTSNAAQAFVLPAASAPTPTEVPLARPSSAAVTAIDDNAPSRKKSPLLILDADEEIAAGNLFDGVAANTSAALAGNVPDASAIDGVSLLRDATSHPTLHSTRVERSDLQLSSADPFAVSQAFVADIPEEQLMRGIIPEVDLSQDFFDPSAVENNADNAAIRQAEVPLQHRSIPDEEAFPSTSVGGAADEAHLSVNESRRSRKKSSSSQKSMRAVTGEMDQDTAPVVPQNDPEYVPQDVPQVVPQEVTQDAPQDAPLGVQAIQPDDPRGVSQDALQDTVPQSPEGIADAESALPQENQAPEASAVLEGDPIAAPPAGEAPPTAMEAPSTAPPARPPSRRPRRHRIWRDVEISIPMNALKSNMRKEQEKEGLEDFPSDLTKHLMQPIQTEIYDMTRVLGMAGKLGAMGKYLTPYFLNSLVTNNRGDAEGNEEEEEGRESEGIDRELTRDEAALSVTGARNSTSINRTSLGPNLSGAEHSRRAERSADRVQGILGASMAETSATRPPAAADEQIPVGNLPAVQEELTAAETEGVDGPPANDDVESVGTVMTTDTAPSATSSVVPTITVQEPSPPEDVPPGTVPGCVKFPDAPEKRPTEKQGKEMADPSVEEPVPRDAPSEPTEILGTPPRGSEEPQVAVDIPEMIPEEQDFPEVFQPPEEDQNAQEVPGASILDDEFVRPAPPSPIIAPIDDTTSAKPSDVAQDPSYRRLPTLQELCPPARCSRKKVIDVFNGILRASMKQLVLAIQDGLSFGGEIALFCRGIDSEHNEDCFCRNEADDYELVCKQFLSFLEPVVPVPPN